MSQDELTSRIERLENRVTYLEDFLMHSLVFRLEDLAGVVEKTSGSNWQSREVFDHIRHVADKARVGGWRDEGP